MQQITSLYKIYGLFVGPSILLVMILIGPVADLSLDAWLTASITLWIAVWWVTEAVPIPITALLPLILFPILNIETVNIVAKSYSSSTVYLLIGGFMLALGLQRCNLHRRIALYILALMGGTPSAIVGGFMFVTALLSMWISNTATTLMMLPIATSVALTLSPNLKENQRKQFKVVLLLSIAYASNIGGLGTLVGTPPNLLMAGFLHEQYNITISFTDWMMFGIPLILIMLPAAWWILTRIAYPLKDISDNKHLVKNTIREQYQSLGKVLLVEKRTAMVFACVVLFWIFRKFIISITGLTGLSDTSIALAGAIALFIIPSGEGKPLMDWKYAKQIPWDVVILYGGGMALASVITSSGLAASFGHVLAVFSSWHLIALIAVVT